MGVIDATKWLWYAWVGGKLALGPSTENFCVFFLDICCRKLLSGRELVNFLIFAMSLVVLLTGIVRLAIGSLFLYSNVFVTLVFDLIFLQDYILD